MNFKFGDKLQSIFICMQNIIVKLNICIYCIKKLSDRLNCSNFHNLENNLLFDLLHILHPIHDIKPKRLRHTK